MRGVCPMRPQPHDSPTRDFQLTRKSNNTSGTKPSRSSNPTAISVGDIRVKPFGVASDSPSVKSTRVSGKCPSPASSRPITGTTANGANPNATQASASITIAACIESGASRACSASFERGIARNVIPNALTKHAAARPLVSASMQTAIGINTATSGCGILKPPSSDWKTIHSEAKPLSGGRAEIAAEPIRKQSAVTGIGLISPPSFSILRVCVACSTEPAPRKSSPLKVA